MRSLTGEMRYRCVCGSWLVPGNDNADLCRACRAVWDRSCGPPTLTRLPGYMPASDDNGLRPRSLVHIGIGTVTAIWLPVDWDAEAEG